MASYKTVKRQKSDKTTMRSVLTSDSAANGRKVLTSGKYLDTLS